MCRSIHCFMSMQGHGHRINNLAELMALMSQVAGKANDPTQAHGDWLAAAIEEADTKLRSYDIALAVLKAAPPEEGAKLVALDVRVPHDAKKHGIASVATYELEGESYLVIGTDHLTGEKVQHTTPNIHGVDGMRKAVVAELDKKSIAAANAEEGQPG